MDGSTVAWIVDQTLRNPQAQRQFGKAAWALTQDTNMARQMPGGVPEGAGAVHSGQGPPAHTPHTDADRGEAAHGGIRQEPD